MQYNLDKLALNGFVYLEMRCAVWGLPQAGILVNKLLQKRLLPHRYFKCPNTPGFGSIPHTPSHSHWLWTIFE